MCACFAPAGRSVRRELVIRQRPGETLVTHVGLPEEMRGLGVTVYDYWLPRASGQGYETFHAKAVLVTGKSATSARANMTEASLEWSMELGFVVRGVQVKRVAYVLDAIIAVSLRK